MEVLTKKIDFKEFQQMEFDDQDPYLYELINGELVRKNTPSGIHQAIQSELFGRIYIFITQNKLGKIFSSPMAVVLTDHDAPQPDLVFLSKENRKKFDREWGIKGAPDLVVEFISQSSVKRDRNDKKELYERHGIKEYWIVDPSYKSVEIYTLQDNRYKLFAYGAENETVKSSVLKNFELEVASIFS